MNAVISGRAGVALIIDGEQMASVNIDAPDEFVPRHAAEFPMLFADAGDLLYLEDVTREEVTAQLEHVGNCNDALYLFLKFIRRRIIHGNAK